jgi:hypothetical protein
MIKYQNRIISEFEDILMSLSKNSSTSYNDAIQYAVKYSYEFSNKKKLNSEDSNDVLELCKELVQDWFPDISNSLVF